MKLSNKEKIVLAVFLAAAIVAMGVFLLIMPEYNRIKTNKSAFEAAKAEREQLYKTLSRDETIDKELEEAIKNVNVFSKYFYDEMTAHEADAIIRKLSADNNMKTKGLTIGDFTTSTLTVSEYVDTIVSYPLKEYSGYKPEAGIDISKYKIEYDENGKLKIPDELKNDAKEFINTLLSSKEQTLGSISVNLTLEGTRGDFLKFLDNVARLERATYIPAVSIEYTGAPPIPNESEAPAITDDITETNTATALAVPAQVRTTADTEPISVSITITLYCAKGLNLDFTDGGTAAQTTIAG